MFYISYYMFVYIKLNHFYVFLLNMNCNKCLKNSKKLIYKQTDYISSPDYISK